MNTCFFLRGLATACAALSIAVCAQGAPPSPNTSPTNAQDWVDNGASACEKYLTPDFLTAILVARADHPQRLDAHSCHAGIIYISLTVTDIDVFRREVPMIAGAHLMAGVGDGAYWNQAGAVSAVKGHHRGCDISIVGTAEQMKIHNAELGQKLGEICNKLFALP